MSIFAGTEFYQAPKCDRCGAVEAECDCPPPEVERIFRDPAKQTARIGKEKRNKGKTVTVIRGLAADDNDLPDLLKKLKNECGAGGCVEEDTIEVQGDHRPRIEKTLKKIGYKTKVI
jgi:translation initiation factor 1